MFEYICDFAKQMEAGISLGERFTIPEGRFSSVVLCGMGGSAIAGDLLGVYRETDLRVPFEVVRSYCLPKWVGKDALVIVSSFSGNTEETLACLEQAVARDLRITAVTTGGKLGDVCGRRHIPIIRLSEIELPPKIPPRAALGYSFGALLTVFNRKGFISQAAGQVEETSTLLRELSGDYRRPESEPGKAAITLRGKLPLIYASSRLSGVVNRFSGQLAENAKTLSHGNCLPEMNHNEIVGVGRPEGSSELMAAVILRSVFDHPRVKERLNITEEVLSDVGIDIIQVNSRGGNVLSDMLSLVYFGDWMSYHLAVAEGIDPIPIQRIDEFKHRLGNDADKKIIK